MQFDYVYGDLKVTITLKAGDDSMFGHLTAAGHHALGQWIYLALSCFGSATSLRMIDLIDKHKYDYLKDEGKEDNG